MLIHVQTVMPQFYYIILRDRSHKTLVHLLVDEVFVAGLEVLEQPCKCNHQHSLAGMYIVYAIYFKMELRRNRGY